MYIQDYDDRTPAFLLDGVHTGRTGNSVAYYTWHEAVQPYAKNWSLFICPSNSSYGPAYINCCSRTSEQYGYGICGFSYPGKAGLMYGVSQSDIGMPAETIWFTDYVAPATTCEFVFPGVYGWGTPPTSYSERCYGGRVCHNGGANYAYYDGHVKWLNESAIKFSMYTGEAD